jgi:hypothetical protein
MESCPSLLDTLGFLKFPDLKIVKENPPNIKLDEIKHLINDNSSDNDSEATSANFIVPDKYNSSNDNSSESNSSESNDNSSESNSSESNSSESNSSKSNSSKNNSKSNSSENNSSKSNSKSSGKSSKKSFWG